MEKNYNHPPPITSKYSQQITRRMTPFDNATESRIDNELTFGEPKEGYNK